MALQISVVCPVFEIDLRFSRARNCTCWHFPAVDAVFDEFGCGRRKLGGERGLARCFAFSPRNRPEADKAEVQLSSCLSVFVRRARLSMAILVLQVSAADWPELSSLSKVSKHSLRCETFLSLPRLTGRGRAADIFGPQTVSTVLILGLVGGLLMLAFLAEPLPRDPRA